MTAEPDALAELSKLKRQYEQLAQLEEKIRKLIVETVILAYKQGLDPKEIHPCTPFSEAWMRAQVRAAGIPKAKPGPKVKNKRRWIADGQTAR